MKLHILFGQRKNTYEGEHAPEALEIADQFTMDENPQWLDGKLAERQKDKEFVALAVVVVEVPFAEIERRLAPVFPAVPGIIVPEKT